MREPEATYKGRPVRYGDPVCTLCQAGLHHRCNNQAPHHVSGFWGFCYRPPCECDCHAQAGRGSKRAIEGENEP